MGLPKSLAFKFSTFSRVVVVSAKRNTSNGLSESFFRLFRPGFNEAEPTTHSVCGRFYDAEETQLFYVPQMSDSFSVLAKPRRFFNSLNEGKQGRLCAVA